MATACYCRGFDPIRVMHYLRTLNRLLPKYIMRLTIHKSYSVWVESEGTRVVYACILPGVVAASEGGSWCGWDPTEPPHHIGLDPERETLETLDCEIWESMSLEVRNSTSESMSTACICRPRCLLRPPYFSDVIVSYFRFTASSCSRNEVRLQMSWPRQP